MSKSVQYVTVQARTTDKQQRVPDKKHTVVTKRNLMKKHDDSPEKTSTAKAKSDEEEGSFTLVTSKNKKQKIEKS